MAAEKQTGVKQRAARIPLDYFRRRSLLERSKDWLAIVAGAIAIGYVGWSAFGGRAAAHSSPGQLAAVHAMWENRCDVCHQDFVPLNSDAFAGHAHGADQSCTNCHSGASHSANEIASEVVSCAACHREHEGRENDLLRVADSACTVCHTDIAAHLKDPAKSLNLKNTTSFLDNHPDFRSILHDPGQLKFSHSRHMRPGLTFGLGPMTLADLGPEDRDRYRKSGRSDQDNITLNCDSCHVLDRSGEPAAVPSSMAGAARPAGDYMLPVSYDLNCKACHQLVYSARPTPKSGETETARYLSISREDRVPHGWSDDALRQYVKQVLDTRFVHDHLQELQSVPFAEVQRQPLEKWRLPNRPPQAAPQAETVGDYLTNELQAAVKNLQIECAECHTMVQQSDSKDGANSEISLAVKPVQVHTAWFEHAKFSHAAHRAVKCQECHPGAYQADLPNEPAPIKTLDNDAVLIPGRTVCLKCHRPEGGDGPDTVGGARFDCVECHDYHQGDNPSRGRGTSALGAAHRVSIRDFINGQFPDNAEKNASKEK